MKEAVYISSILTVMWKKAIKKKSSLILEDTKDEDTWLYMPGKTWKTRACRQRGRKTSSHEKD